jgi:hypothetical protein
VSDDRIDFTVGGELVTRYHKGASVAKPYFWPVVGPGGTAMTRAWPMLTDDASSQTTDHVHQKSIWFCHGDVIPEGLELKQKIRNVEGVDFWSEGTGHGVIACTQVGEPKYDKDHAQVTTRNEWRTADGVKVLDENRTIHLYDLGAARLLVLDIDLHASVCPITFGDTKEGSMGIRINDVMREQKGNGKLENAEGKTGEKALWGHVSAWCDYSGKVGDRQVGLALFADPSNSVASSWHSRGYGLMAANPFGRTRSGFPAMKGKTDLVKLGKGEHLKLRFGILIHPGDAQEGKVGEYFERFVKMTR